MWSVLVVEDENSVREAVGGWLRLAGCFVVHEADSLATARVQIEANTFDAVILDLDLPDGGGAELLPDIRNRFASDAAVIVISGLDSIETSTRLMHEGADDFLSKPFTATHLYTRLSRLLHISPSDYTERARCAFRDTDSAGLTPREVQVLIRLRQGKTNGEIAESLHTKEKTVENQVASLLKKLGAVNRTDAVAISYRRNVLLDLGNSDGPR